VRASTVNGAALKRAHCVPPQPAVLMCFFAIQSSEATTRTSACECPSTQPASKLCPHCMETCACRSALARARNRMISYCGVSLSRAGRSSGTMLGPSSAWLAAALMYCAFVCDVAGAAPPTTMAAFLESKLRQQEYVTNAVTPALGSLRTKYAALPSSCELLIKVHQHPAAPHQCTHPPMLDRSALLFVHTLANVLCCPRGHERVCVICSEACSDQHAVD
jgi:hypothetical protein